MRSTRNRLMQPRWTKYVGFIERCSLAKPEVKFRLNEPDCHNSITNIDFQIVRDLSYLSTDNNRGMQRLEFL